MASKTSAPGPEQLKIAQQLASVVSTMAANVEKITKGFESQAEATTKMAENMKGMGTGEVVSQLVQVNETLKQVSESLNKLNETQATTFEAMQKGAASAATGTQQLSQAVNESGKAAAASRSSFDSLKETLGKTGKGSKDLRSKLEDIGGYLQSEFPVATGAALGALSGLQQGFSNLVAMGSSIMGFFSGLISSAWELGKSILSIPFKIFDGLVEKANSASGGISELAEAINNLRKEFGALSGPTNTAIMSTAKSLGSLQLAGTTAMQVFGNLADRIKAVTELFTQGGPAIRMFSQEIMDDGGAALALQKGLGLTGEQMGSLAKIAKAKGQSFDKSLVDMTKYSDVLAKKFGLDAKLISKGIGEMVQDIGHFGSMTPKALAAASAYMQKLGLQVKDLTGLIDGFDNFDDAADSVSTLNSQLGTNLDFEAMFQEQDPAKRMQMISKSLQEQGLTYDKLDGRQKRAIASTMHLTDEQVAAALGNKDAAGSLTEMGKATDSVEKKAMTTEEAISKLSDAMERLLKSAGGDRPKSFWEAFLGGIEKGISITPEFLGLMKNLRFSTDDFTRAGKEVGKMIVDLVPGVKDMIVGLKNMFDPGVIKQFTQGAVADIRKFIDDFKNGKASLGDLMDHLKEKFFNFFNKQEGPGRKLLEGFQKFFTFLRDMFAMALKWVMTKLGEFVKDIVEFIRAPDTETVSGLKDGAQSFLGPIADAFKEGWKVLRPALVDLLGELFDGLIKILGDLAKKHWGKIALVLFGPMFAQAMLGALIPSLAGALVKGLAGMVSGEGATGIAGAIQGAVGKLSDTLKAGGAPGAGMADAAKEAAETAGAAGSPTGLSPASVANMEAVGASITPGLIIKFLLALAGIIAIGLISFYAAAKMVEGMSMDTIVKAMMVLGTIAVESLVIGGALVLLKAIPTPDLTLVAKLAAIGVVMLALAALGWVITKMVSGLNMQDIIKATVLMGGMELVATGAALLIPLLATAGEILLSGAGVAALAGLGAVAVLVVAMAGLGWLMVKSISGLSPEELIKAGAAYASVAVAVAGIAVALLSLMAVGFGAIAGAAFLGAGFLVVAAAIVGMKPVAWALQKGAPSDPEGLKRAGEAYAAVGEAVIGIAKSLLSIMAVGFGAVVGFGAMVVGFLVVAAAVDGMKPVAVALQKGAPSDPEGLKKAGEAYAAVGEAVIGIAKSLLVLMGLGFVAILGFSAAVAGFVVIVAAVKGMKPVADALVSGAPSDPEALKKAGEAYAAVGEAVIGIQKALVEIAKLGFGAILSAGSLVAGIAAIALTIPALAAVAAEMRKFSIDPTEMIKAGFSYSATAFAVGQIQDALVKIADVGFDAIKNLTGMIAGVFALAGAIPALAAVGDAIAKGGAKMDPNGIDLAARSYSAIAMAVGQISEAMGKVGSMGLKQMIPFLRTTDDDFEKLTNALGSLGKVGKKMMEEGSGLSDGVVTAAKGFAAVAEAVGTIAKAMDTIGDFGSISSRLANMFSSEDKGIEKLNASIPQLAILGVTMQAYGLVIKAEDIKKATDGFAAVSDGITKISEGMQKLSNVDFSSMDSINLNPQDISKKMSEINSFLDSVLGSPLVTAAGEKVKQLQALQEVVARGIIPSVKAVEDMIAAAQKIEKSLEQGIKIDLDAKLRTFASKFGKVGAQGAYTVQARDVNIEVTFNVTMDARSIEPALINNSSSVIRNRLNLLIDAVQDGTTADTAKKELANSGMKIPP